MLVLSRRVGERLKIGDNILVEIVRIGSNSVRLAIEAPQHLDIAREELVVNRASLVTYTDRRRADHAEV